MSFVVALVAPIPDDFTLKNSDNAAVGLEISCLVRCDHAYSGPRTGCGRPPGIDRDFARFSFRDQNAQLISAHSIEPRERVT